MGGQFLNGTLSISTYARNRTQASLDERFGLEVVNWPPGSLNTARIWVPTFAERRVHSDCAPPINGS
jgi:hypothetical protein